MTSQNSAQQPPMIGVIGAGVMGQGIAQLCAQSGCHTLLHDVSPEACRTALRNIETALQKRVDRGRLDAATATATLRRLSIAEQLEDFAGADIVVEAVVEDLAIKHQLVRQLEQHCSAETLICTNTSSLPVTAIAAPARYPERIAGLHFFNPAPVMKLVEVVRATQTDDAVIDRLLDFARSLGKIPVVAKDSPAFIVNRCARPFYSESLVMLEQGLADAATLDQAIRDNLGTPLGPFELMDLVGLDINLKATETVWAAFNQHPRFAPSPEVCQRVEQGQLGRKTGQGFHDYSTKAEQPARHKTAPNAENAATLAEHLAGTLGLPVAVSDGRLAREAAAGKSLLWLDQNLVHWQESPVTLACVAVGLNDSQTKQALAAAQSLGVRLVPVADQPGLIAQRLAVMLEQEASRVVKEGVARAEDIDTALCHGLNFRAGPFTLNADIDDRCAERILERLRANDTTGRYED